MAKTTSPKSRKLTSVPPQSRTEREPSAPTGDDRQQRIAERAYQLAEQRGFVPGGEVADWLAAEREVDAELRRS
jgi:hypothetical protein